MQCSHATVSECVLDLPSHTAGVYLTVSEEGEMFTWVNPAYGMLNAPEHTKSMWKNPASAPSFGAKADLTSAQTTAQPDPPPAHESFMRRVETVGTLYGLIQTWPASPQTPQVGNLVPRHIGFDVTTPSGSIFFFFFFFEGSHLVSLLAKHFCPFHFGYGERFSARGRIVIRAPTRAAGYCSVLEGVKRSGGLRRVISHCFHARLRRVSGSNRTGSTGEIQYVARLCSSLASRFSHFFVIFIPPPRIIHPPHPSASLASNPHLPSFLSSAFRSLALLSLHLHTPRNQNGFPWGTALNIILNFSFLICAASFTLNLLPRAKKQHGTPAKRAHATENAITAYPSLFSARLSPSLSLPHCPRQHGNGGAPQFACSHLGPELSSLSISRLPASASLFGPFLSVLPSRSSRSMLSLPTSVSLFLRLPLRLHFTPSCSEVILSPPLPSLIHHHHPPFPSLSLSLSLSLCLSISHTHTHTVCTHIDMHKSSLHISVTASGQYRGLIAFGWVDVRYIMYIVLSITHSISYKLSHVLLLIIWLQNKRILKRIVYVHIRLQWTSWCESKLVSEL